MEAAKNSECWGIEVKHLIRENNGGREKFLGAQAKMQKKAKGRWQEMKHKLQPVLRVTRDSSVPCYEVWTLFGEHDG